MLSTAAGDEIVNADDLVAARQQQVGQMRPEKAGGAGDDGGGLFLFHFLAHSVPQGAAAKKRKMKK